MSRRSIIAVEDFYTDPHAVRSYALEQRYYLPYQDEEAMTKPPCWWSSWYQPASRCPIKSNQQIIEQLQDAVGERIDLDHWNATYPVNNRSKPLHRHPDARNASLWHCSFHVKLDNHQKLGGGVHNHVTDVWNSVGTDGWAGIIYLAPDAPVEGGLHLWRNTHPENTFDWMTPAENWVHLDGFANLFNRLVLVRGNIPHSGANGWGESVATGRMFQTFFFKTLDKPKSSSVDFPKCP